MPPKRAPRRRTGRHTKGSRPILNKDVHLTVGPLTIDRLRHEVKVGNQPIHLTPREFDLLWTLARHPGKVYRREELLSQVWGKEIFVALRTVDVHMAKLRQKLRSAESQPDIAETIWGVGYRLRIGSS